MNTENFENTEAKQGVRKGDVGQVRTEQSVRKAHSAGVFEALRGYFQQKRVKKAILWGL